MRNSVTGSAVRLPREPLAVEAETERDAAHDRLAERRERVHVVEHRAPQAGRRRREQIRAVQGSSGAHTRVVGRELGPEVDPFLAIGSPRRQFAADGEPAPPGAAAACHRDRGLFRIRAREEVACARVEPVAQPGVDTVADDREEAEVATRVIDRARNGRLFTGTVTGTGAGDQRPDIDRPKRHGHALGSTTASPPLASRR